MFPNIHALRNIYIYAVNNKRTLIKDALSYINIHRHVSVASATIIRVLYKNADNI